MPGRKRSLISDAPGEKPPLSQVEFLVGPGRGSKHPSWPCCCILESMDVGEIERLLYAIGAHDRVRLRRNGWVEAACPFAPWKHAKGIDRHPSFAISVVPGGTSRYRCHACGAAGEIGLPFMWKYQKMSGKNLAHLASFVENTNAPSLGDISRRLAVAASGTKPPSKVAGVQVSLGLVGGEVPDLPVMSDEELEAFVPEFPEELVQYLTGSGYMVVANEDVRCRGLASSTLVEWEILWSEEQRRIAIPIRDVEGNLVAISGRAWPPNRKPKYLHTKGYKRDYYLYGEHRVVKGKPAILVEGQFDAVVLSQHGYVNVFAVLGSYVSAMQVEKLVQWCPSVRVLGDGDDAGRKGAQASADMISRRIPAVALRCPDGIDPGDLSKSDAEALLGVCA